MHFEYIVTFRIIILGPLWIRFLGDKKRTLEYICGLDLPLGLGDLLGIDVFPFLAWLSFLFTFFVMRCS